MFNSDLPNRADLPTPSQLLRSTILAATAATGILITTILPAEYAIDPTGVGRLLGLTQMGEIKKQLALEVQQDASGALVQNTQNETLIVIMERLDQIERKMTALTPAPQTEKSAEVAEAIPVPDVASNAPVVVGEPETVAEDTTPAPPATVGSASADQMEITLEPNQGAEIKLEMREGAEVAFRWTVDGGVVNYDTHGDPYEKPKDFYHGYGKGRQSPGEEGTLKAAFDGMHGWFWRNRSDAPVVIKLETNGNYIQIKRVI